MRYLLLLALIACSDASGSKLDVPAQPARNLVCERWATLNPKATCVAEMSGYGDLNTHTARVTIEKDTVACALNAGQVSLVCASLVYQAPAEKPQPVTAPAPKAKK
jgi:hypothetical protein